MTNTVKDLPLIKLIGEPSENFYQLGLKDRDRHKPVISHINKLIKTPWKALDLVAGEVLKQVLTRTLADAPEFKKNITAYSEGLAVPFDEVARALLTPELLSFMTKWIPGVPPNLLGCSSFFYLDEDLGHPAHGRILDFPLLNSFDAEERLLLTKFKGGPQIFSYGAHGMPYPGLTAMNSEGVSFALHQKFTNKLFSGGTPIFELAYQLMKNVGDKKSAIDFLRNHQSLTTWGFNIGFKNGDVLTADLSGEELHFTEHHLELGKVIYVNNKLENKNLDQESFFPYGFDNFNQLKEDVAKEKIKSLKNKKLNIKSMLEIMSLPLKTKKLRPDPATMSSLGISIFSAGAESAFINTGPAPKYFNGAVHKIKSIWKAPVQEVVQLSKKKTDLNYYQGMRHLMLAQTSFDKSEHDSIYHHLQMSIDLLKDFPEKYMASFYFLIFQYMEEKNTKARHALLDQFKSLEGKLTPYLEDNRKLFVFRLEGLTKTPATIKEEDFENQKIKTIFKQESRLPILIFHQATTLLLNPRIDMWDIIHAHIKA